MGSSALTDAADEDWASWYADWLVHVSELPRLLGAPPVRSHVTHLLVERDREYSERSPGAAWRAYYANRFVEYFSAERA